MNVVPVTIRALAPTNDTFVSLTWRDPARPDLAAALDRRTRRSAPKNGTPASLGGRRGPERAIADGGYPIAVILEQQAETERSSFHDLHAEGVFYVRYPGAVPTPRRISAKSLPTPRASPGCCWVRTGQRGKLMVPSKAQQARVWRSQMPLGELPSFGLCSQNMITLMNGGSKMNTDQMKGDWKQSVARRKRNGVN